METRLSATQGRQPPSPLPRDQRFKTGPDRKAHRDALIPIVPAEMPSIITIQFDYYYDGTLKEHHNSNGFFSDPVRRNVLNEAGKALGISTATAYRHWNYARAWLHAELMGTAEA